MVTDFPNLDVTVVDVRVAVGFGIASEGSTKSVSRGGEVVALVVWIDVEVCGCVWRTVVIGTLFRAKTEFISDTFVSGLRDIFCKFKFVTPIGTGK